ncbi:double-strand break repair protein AddB [Consotaella salsifontis]|uniref:ATP-dependent helicase/nuclease subunit B n=1 Tax=Consotaella salsifontis TaxID=1365950 RepID=A0A1T4QHY9_9HYPH|nr:double-strand break repair protein AddB [Consotaella salsifontis]SKA03410.1 ATP-dependent helicase/nuclease subunit B [Consotaella salsifontis]
MRPHLFSIPPGVPFLRTLAGALASGELVPGFSAAGDPLAFAAATIFVPTRRAARVLAAEIGAALGGEAAILPSIRLLGAVDETSLVFTSGAPDLSATMDALERRLLIARLVRQWKSQISTETIRLLAKEEVDLPASSADALWLSGDLCALLDEVEDQAIDLAPLATLAPDRLAHWWQLTLTFLQILTKHWPEVLAERGVVDAARARNAWLRGEAERLTRDGARGPVIVAGSTATAPATLAFLKAVAHLPNGAVVLPGLDRDLDRSAYEAIDLARSAAAPGHAQYGLKRILAALGAERDEVTHLDAALPPLLRARERLVADALRPAETTDAWAGALPEAGALDDLALIEAGDEREEALAIAAALRTAISKDGTKAALVTPDRNLARRVVSELSRFGIAANDSAGRPLAATAPGTLLILAAEVALQPGDPVPLLSLLKHPLARFGLSADAARRAARTIEMIALRGGAAVADVVGLAGLYDKRRAALEEEGARPARPIALVSHEDRDMAATVARDVEAALAPLTGLRASAPQEIAAFATAATKALEALCRDSESDASNLYAEEAGTALATFLSALVHAPETRFSFDPFELPDVLRALMAGETVKPRGGLSARVFIWGALEARLQSVDTVILGGLNEGSWPGAARNDAFLSRIMRTDLALDPPERRIGLAAHDFTMALGASRAILSRSLRSGGAPTIASRWLQRLLTIAGPDGAAELRQAGAPYLTAARTLDELPPEKHMEPPAPRPPLAQRPTRFSVTEVETLIRDPYAVHARRILRLEKMPPLIRDPGAADRGSLYHRILARFVMEGVAPRADDAESRLIEIAREEFLTEDLPVEVEAVWWPRMEGLARRFLEWERGRDEAVKARHAELGGWIELADIGLTLTGFADRIDELKDGSLELIDFKTGTEPSAKQARTLLAPQLPLEGAMVKRGGFKGLEEGRRVADLLYVRLRERDFYDERLSFEDKKAGVVTTADDLSEAALEKLKGLHAAYRDEKRPYLARQRPFRAGDFSADYDHLSRAREWAAGDDGAGDGE